MAVVDHCVDFYYQDFVDRLFCLKQIRKPVSINATTKEMIWVIQKYLHLKSD